MTDSVFQDNEGENQMVRGWTEFEANPKGFPKGMKYAISNIREKYPEIKHIAVWHALVRCHFLRFRSRTC